MERIEAGVAADATDALDRREGVLDLFKVLSTLARSRGAISVAAIAVASRSSSPLSTLKDWLRGEAFSAVVADAPDVLSHLASRIVSPRVSKHFSR